MSIQDTISQKLTAACSPNYIEVVNESYKHNVPEGAESHFKVIVVSDVFEGKRKVARHQLVYGLLSEELEGPVHALAIFPYAPDEWADQKEAPQTPDCLG